MENNIYFSNISKSFDGKIVLDNLSHGFKLNQVHVILGKSGMGKSVLLKMLMGLMKPDSGKILINNIISPIIDFIVKYGLNFDIRS